MNFILVGTLRNIHQNKLKQVSQVDLEIEAKLKEFVLIAKDWFYIFLR